MHLLQYSLAGKRFPMYPQTLTSPHIADSRDIGSKSATENTNICHYNSDSWTVKHIARDLYIVLSVILLKIIFMYLRPVTNAYYRNKK